MSSEQVLKIQRILRYHNFKGQSENMSACSSKETKFYLHIQHILKIKGGRKVLKVEKGYCPREIMRDKIRIQKMS